MGSGMSPPPKYGLTHFSVISQRPAGPPDRHWNGEEWVHDDELYEALDAAALAIQAYHNGDRAWAEKWLLKALRVGKQACLTCGGRGEIGGFVNAHSGYQTDPCPDCAER